MSGQTYQGPSPDGHGRFRAWLQQRGHDSVRTMLILAVACSLPTPVGGGPIAWAAMAGMLSWFVIELMANVTHMRGLCEKCIAEFPLDAQAQAENRRRILRFMHVRTERWGIFLLAEAIVLIGACYFCTVRNGGWSWNPGLAVVFSWYVAMTWAHAVHRRLQPVCPWCRGRWGRDDEEDAPEPDPEGHGVSPQHPVGAA